MLNNYWDYLLLYLNKVQNELMCLRITFVHSPALVESYFHSMLIFVWCKLTQIKCKEIL